MTAKGYLPTYFNGIADRLREINRHRPTGVAGRKLGGGTDLYVQRPVEMYESAVVPVYDDPKMNSLSIQDGICTFGASLTMGDLYRSDAFKQILPDAGPIFKLLSSTQIRNMATIGGTW